MKKSLLAVFLVLCMVLGAMLVACGDDKSEETTKADESESASTPEESTSESTSETSSAPEESSSEPESLPGDPTVEKSVSAKFSIVTPPSLSNTDRKSLDYLKKGIKDTTNITLFTVNEGMMETAGVTDYVRLAFSSEMETGEYTVVAYDGNMTITAADSLSLYFATTAVVDKWITADGGLRDGKLYISGEIAGKLSGLPTPYGELFTVMSQNVRCATPEDEAMGLLPEVRAERFQLLLADVLPDVVGLQEVTREWREYIEEYYEDLGYDVVWGETNDKTQREDAQYVPILYKADRFTLVDSGTIWMTSTPEEKSLVVGAAAYSICTWAKLTDSVSGRTFMMLNAKFEEPMGDDTARTANMNALLGYLTQKGITGNIPTVFVCDLNASSTTTKAYESATYSVFANASSSAESRIQPVSGTYHGYYGAGSGYDYIFYNPDSVWALAYETIVKNYYNEGNTLQPGDDGYDKAGYVSDHYAILGTLLIKDAQ